MNDCSLPLGRCHGCGKWIPAFARHTRGGMTLTILEHSDRPGHECAGIYWPPRGLRWPFRTITRLARLRQQHIIVQFRPNHTVRIT